MTVVSVYLACELCVCLLRDFLEALRDVLHSALEMSINTTYRVSISFLPYAVESASTSRASRLARSAFCASAELPPPALTCAVRTGMAHSTSSGCPSEPTDAPPQARVAFEAHHARLVRACALSPQDTSQPQQGCCMAAGIRWPAPILCHQPVAERRRRSGCAAGCAPGLCELHASEGAGLGPIRSADWLAFDTIRPRTDAAQSSCRGSPRRSSSSRSRKPWRWWTRRRPRSSTRRLAWSPTCSAPAPRRCSRASHPDG